MNSYNPYRYWAIKDWVNWSKRWPVYLAGSSMIELVTLVLGYVPTTASLTIGFVAGSCIFAKTLCDLYDRNALGTIAMLGYFMPIVVFIQKTANAGDIFLPLVSLLAFAWICLSLLYGFVGSYIHPDISAESDASSESGSRSSP